MEPLLWCIKYRPKSWDEFIGHEQTLSHLQSLAESGTLTNMIFYGPSGTGKTAAAHVFSRAILGTSFNANFKSLNIRDIWDFSMTDAKRSVQDLAKLSRDARTELDEYMSIVYREAQSTLKLKGQNRPPSKSQLLQEAIKFFASTTTVSDEKVKILVLDEADALTSGMQQALRRTMEIYSDACRFILITPSLSGWSPAVISRCQVLHFPLLSDSVISNHLHDIAKREGIILNDDAASAIAREASGDLRRAINLLQISAIASSQVTEDIVYAHSVSYLSGSIKEIVSLAIDGSYEEARKKVRSLVAIDGYAPEEVILEMERDLVKRPFNPVLLSQILSRVAEIDYRLTKAKNSFVHIAALLASLRELTVEIN